MTDSDVYAAAEIQTEFDYTPSDDINPWAGVVDDPQTVQLLNHLDNTLPKPVHETAIGKEILGNAATKMLDEAVREGNVSQEKRVSGITKNDSTEAEFFWEVADRLSYEGSIGLVFGSPGSGKTAKMLDIGSMWRGMTNGLIFGNLEANILAGQFSSDQELFELMARNQGQSLALIDEVAQELSGFGSGNKLVESFTDRMLMIRKREREFGPYAKRGSALIIAHTRTKTAKEIRRLANFAIEVPNRTNPDEAVILDSTDGKDVWERYDSYSGITDTDAEYDEHESSEFRIEIDYDDEEKSESAANMPEKPDEVERAVSLVINEGLSQSEAADEVGIAQGTVSEWKQRWESGKCSWMDIDD